MSVLANTFFRKLDFVEIAAFRSAARENYTPGTPIEPAWHPVYRAECELMNAEETYEKRTDCDVCRGRGWALFSNSDHGLRVERCDPCSYPGLTDEEAYALAGRELLRYLAG